MTYPTLAMLRQYEENRFLKWFESLYQIFKDNKELATPLSMMKHFTWILPAFKEHNINGEIFLELNHEVLREMAIKLVGQRMVVLILVKQIRLFLIDIHTPKDKVQERPKSNFWSKPNRISFYNNSQLHIKTSPSALPPLSVPSGTPPFPKNQSSKPGLISSMLTPAGGRQRTRTAPGDSQVAQIPSPFVLSSPSINDESHSLKNSKSESLPSFTPRQANASPDLQQSFSVSSSKTRIHLSPVTSNGSKHGAKSAEEIKNGIQSVSPGESTSGLDHKRVIRVFGEDEHKPSVTVDLTRSVDAEGIYKIIFHRFKMIHDKDNIPALKQLIATWGLYLSDTDNFVHGARILSESELLTYLKDGSLHDWAYPNSETANMSHLRVPRCFLRRRDKMQEYVNLVLRMERKKEKIEHIFGEPISQPTGIKSKLSNFFGQRPPSELVTTNLAQFFPNVRNTRRMSTVMMNSAKSSSIQRAGSSSSLNRTIIKSNLSHSITNTNKEIESAIPEEDIFQEVEDDSHLTDDDEDIVPANQIDISISAPVGSSPYQDRSAVGILKREHSTVTGSGSSTPSQASSLHSTDSYATKRVSRKIKKWLKGTAIGKGSFGEVCMGLNGQTGELMAVKQVPLPTSDTGASAAQKNIAIESLKKEIQIFKAMDPHPNIVQYLGSELTKTHLNIFLEYVPGGSLTTVIKVYGVLPEELVRTYSSAVLHGLSFLHGLRIIHRDIKGANILVDNKGIPKIADFGISLQNINNNSTGKRGSVESIVVSRPKDSLQGTVFWMAPEVIKSHHYTKKSDIWSFGCLIIEMVTGKRPWPKLNQLQAIMKIGSGEVPDFPLTTDLKLKAKSIIKSEGDDDDYDNFSLTEESQEEDMEEILISDHLHDLLVKCLDPEFKNRPSADNLLEHKFFNLVDEVQSVTSFNKSNGSISHPSIKSVKELRSVNRSNSQDSLSNHSNNSADSIKFSSQNLLNMNRNQSKPSNSSDLAENKTSPKMMKVSTSQTSIRSGSPLAQHRTFVNNNYVAPVVRMKNDQSDIPAPSSISASQEKLQRTMSTNQNDRNQHNSPTKLSSNTLPRSKKNESESEKKIQSPTKTSSSSRKKEPTTPGTENWMLK